MLYRFFAGPEAGVMAAFWAGFVLREAGLIAYDRTRVRFFRAD